MGGRRRRKALLGLQDLVEGLRWLTPRQQGLPGAGADGLNRLGHWGLSHHLGQGGAQPKSAPEIEPSDAKREQPQSLSGGLANAH